MTEQQKKKGIEKCEGRERKIKPCSMAVNSVKKGRDEKALSKSRVFLSICFFPFLEFPMFFG